MAVTHMQIARAAGVSQSSVSRALTGSVKINCEKAAYIRKIAEEMGYFDERRQKKHEIYGSIYPKIAIFVPELSGWYYTTYIQAMQDAIERIGGFMSVYVVGFEPVRARMIVEQLLHNDRIDCAVSILSNHLELDESTHIPFIQMLPQTSFAEQSLTAVIRMLRDKKHHAIGFIGEKNTFAKLDAFRYSMEQASLPVDESLIYTSDYRFEQIGHDGIRAFCIRGVMPTAIVCAYDEVAFGAVTELRAKGYRVPEDVSVVGYNNIPFCAYFDPPLTSVDEKVEERAQEALQLLQDVLIDKSRIHEPLIVPYHNTLVDAVNVFTTGCDVQKIIKDNNGIPIFNVNNEHTANVLDKILPMFSNRNYTVEPMTWKGDVPGDI